MDEARASGRRWRSVGKIVLCVVVYFWAVWLLDSLLPPRPEETPFEAYLEKQIRSGKASVRPWSAEAKDLSEQLSAEAAQE